MAGSSTTPTPGDAGYLRWLKAGQGLLELRRTISRTTMRIMVDFHKDICRALPAAAAATPGCSCKPENITGSGMNTSCATCNHFLAEIRKAQKGKPIKYRNNSDPCKWATDPWEVAKSFMGQSQLGGNHGPEQTDCSNVVLLWEQCTNFHRFIFDPKLLTKVREARNHLMHKPDMKLSETEMKDDFFQPMIDLLGDVLLSRQPDIESDGVTRLEEIRDKEERVFAEDELKVWLDLVQGLGKSFEQLRSENEPVAEFLVRNPNLLQNLERDWPKLQSRVADLERRVDGLVNDPQDELREALKTHYEAELDKMGFESDHVPAHVHLQAAYVTRQMESCAEVGDQVGQSQQLPATERSETSSFIPEMTSTA